MLFRVEKNWENWKWQRLLLASSLPFNLLLRQTIDHNFNLSSLFARFPATPFAWVPPQVAQSPWVSALDLDA